MNQVLLSKEQFEEIKNHIHSIYRKIDEKDTPPEKLIYSNDELCELLGISKRTAQNYRDKQLITFSQVGGKIFYHHEDIEAFLDKHKIEATNQD